jgi:predicted metal-dependent hydrolase
VLIDDIEVNIIRKNVKNLRLGVYPPDGRVRITVPWHVSDAYIQGMINNKLNWIKEKQSAFISQGHHTPNRLTSGETIYFMGRPYSLEVIERPGRTQIAVKNQTQLLIAIAPGSTVLQRNAVLEAWYRKELSLRIPPLIEKWEAAMGQRVLEWRIKKMKTRWGTCNAHARRIWLSLELAKKPEACLEYVVVHEMVHFFERYHNARFKSHMDTFLPDWRRHKDLLNKIPSID